MNSQMFKLDLEKAEEPEIKLPTSVGSSKKRQHSRKASTSTLLTTQSLDCVDHNKLWKILQGMEILGHLTCLLRNLHVKRLQLEADMEQWTGSKLRREYKAVYRHPAYLTSM